MKHKKFFCNCNKGLYCHVSKEEKDIILKENGKRDMHIGFWKCQGCGRFKWSM